MFPKENKDLTMTEDFKDKLLNNWHPRRWIALVAGAFLIFQAFWHWDGLSGLLGGFFLFQAATNSGCFGSRSCAVPAGRETGSSATNEIKNVEFTEIKES